MSDNRLDELEKRLAIQNQQLKEQIANESARIDSVSNSHRLLETKYHELNFGLSEKGTMLKILYERDMPKIEDSMDKTLKLVEKWSDRVNNLIVDFGVHTQEIKVLIEQTKTTKEAIGDNKKIQDSLNLRFAALGAGSGGSVVLLVELVRYIAKLF